MLHHWYERNIKNQEILSDLKGVKWFISYTKIGIRNFIATHYLALVKKDEISIGINQYSDKEMLQDCIWITFKHDYNNIKNFTNYLNDLVEHLESTGYDFRAEDSFLYGCPPNVSNNESLEKQKEISKNLVEKGYNYTEKWR